MILRLVASFSQSMSPWRATAPHFVPKSLVTNMTKTCSNHTKPPKLIYNLSKRSINIKNSANVSTKLYNFDINRGELIWQPRPLLSVTLGAAKQVAAFPIQRIPSATRVAQRRSQQL